VKALGIVQGAEPRMRFTMPADSPTATRSLQGRKAAAGRWGHSNKDELARDYAAAKLEDYITRTVNAAPPLTPAQRDQLAMLLRGGGPDAA